MGDDEHDSSPPVPAVPPSDTLWLVATHHRGDVEDWGPYAHRSRPGFVRLMSDRPYPPARPFTAASLSTLRPAVTSLGELRTTERAVLVMMMHGIVRLPYIVGRLHTAQTNPDLDLPRMATDTEWNPPYLPFGWPQRLRNRHYREAVEAIRGLQRIGRVHLYGCRIGQPTFISALGDFARDIGKEVWAYTGLTHTLADDSNTFLRIINVSDGATRAEKLAAPDSHSVAAQGSGFRRVTLRTTLGVLPGWQMRAHANAEVDLLGRDMLGPAVQSFQSGEALPNRTVSVTT
jgi:hypothetical protein